METFSMLLTFSEGNSSVTGGFPGIPLTKARDVELWYFLQSELEQMATIETPVIRDAIMLIMT